MVNAKRTIKKCNQRIRNNGIDFTVQSLVAFVLATILDTVIFYTFIFSSSMSAWYTNLLSAIFSAIAVDLTMLVFSICIKKWKKQKRFKAFSLIAITIFIVTNIIVGAINYEQTKQNHERELITDSFEYSGNYEDEIIESFELKLLKASFGNIIPICSSILILFFNLNTKDTDLNDIIDENLIIVKQEIINYEREIAALEIKINQENNNDFYRDLVYKFLETCKQEERLKVRELLAKKFHDPKISELLLTYDKGDEEDEEIIDVD